MTALPSPSMTDRKREPRPGEGRPRLGAGPSVRVTVIAELDQRARWEAAADKADQSLSEWMRDTLDEAAR